jgi:hypothetical protein
MRRRHEIRQRSLGAFACHTCRLLVPAGPGLYYVVQEEIDRLSQFHRGHDLQSWIRFL